MTAAQTDQRPASVWAWIGIALTMTAGSVIVHFGDHADLSLSSPWAQAIDWQPARAFSEPWRAWTAVFVHHSDLHLAANLAGSVGVAAWGGVARVPARTVVAWLIAWPLVHWGLWMQPGLLHYGGLSGVLHAGIAVVAVHLVCSGTRIQQRTGAAVLAALVVKLLTEAPWQGAISHPAGWDIAVAPGSHVSGVLAGTIVSALAEGVQRVFGTVREARHAVDAHD